MERGASEAPETVFQSKVPSIIKVRKIKINSSDTPDVGGIFSHQVSPFPSILYTSENFLIWKAVPFFVIVFLNGLIY